MNSIWDQAKAISETQSSGGGLFVRLKNDKEKVSGVFVGDPVMSHIVWTGTKTEAYDKRRHSELGIKPKLQVLLNFYDVASGSMRVYECGSRVLKDLVKLREKYGFEKWVFEIGRDGAPGDTQTKYAILPDRQIDAALAAKIAATPKHDLWTYAKGTPIGGPSSDESGGIPF